MADLNHPAAVSFLRHYGFLTRSDPTVKYLPVTGRADIIALRKGQAVHVEVKQNATSFKIDDDDPKGSGWRDSQRNWARFSQMTPFEIPYWIFLTLGKHPPNYDKKKYMPKRSWLIPFDYLEEVRMKIHGIQKSIPYRISVNTKSEFKDVNMSAIWQFREYELTWAKDMSLKKPIWVDYTAMLDVYGDRLSEMEVTRLKLGTRDEDVYYGGIWTLPENHSFYQLYLKDK